MIGVLLKKSYCDVDKQTIEEMKCKRRENGY